MVEGFESEYQKYELSEDVKFAFGLIQSQEVVHLWQTLEDFNANISELSYKGCLLYMHKDRFGKYHRNCIPQTTEWLRAKSNDGYFVDTDNSKVYVIKSTGIMKVLDIEECQIESAKRMKVYEEASSKIQEYLKTKTKGGKFEFKLIGSSAMGTATEISDIDVLIDIKIAYSDEDLFQFCKSLQSEFGYRFDFIYDKSKINILIYQMRHFGF